MERTEGTDGTGGRCVGYQLTMADVDSAVRAFVLACHPQDGQGALVDVAFTILNKENFICDAYATYPEAVHSYSESELETIRALWDGSSDGMTVAEFRKLHP